MNGIDATKALLKLALDASALRHQAVANNLANMHSVGYVPLRVNFDEQLGAMRQTLAAGGEISPAQTAAVRPYIVQDAQAPIGQATAMIETEMIKLSQNTLHFQSLLKALQKRGAIMSLAVNEGRP